MMRSGNPALNERIFTAAPYSTANMGNVMTLQGTVNKCFILLALLMATSIYSWNAVNNMVTIDPMGNTTSSGTPMIMMWGGLIGGLIFAMITIFKKSWAPVTAPIYALLEGLVVGSISAIYNAQFQGIVFQAVMLTAGILFALLIAYKSRLIKVTENFKLGVAAATGGIFILYLLSFVLGFFGVQMSFLHDSSPLSIGISMVICVVAALNLVMDFDFIENASASANQPKYMEWYGAFGLMVTLIWLYLEILRLLAKLQSRK